MDEAQDVGGHQPTPGPDRSGAQVGGDEHLQVRAGALLPRGRGLALWRTAMARENIPHGLGTDGVAQIGSGTYDTIIAPRAIFLRQREDYTRPLCLNPRAPWRLAWRRAVELLRDAFAVPAKNRLGFDDLGDFRQGFLAQLLADLGQGLARAVTQLEAPVHLVTEHPVFRHDRRVAHQQFLIDGSRDVREQGLPIHPPFTLRLFRLHAASSMPDRVGSLPADVGTMAAS